jgi:TolA-binding protein
MPAVERSYPEAQDLYNQGIERVWAKDTEGALAVFQDLVRDYPQAKETAPARYWLGECFFALKNYAAAAEQFAACLGRTDNPKREAALLMLGQAYFRLHRDDEAVRQFVTLMEEYPDGQYFDRAGLFIHQISNRGR